MNRILPIFVAISALPSWWWTKGPGLGDPAPDRRQDRFLTAGLTLAAGLGAAVIFGKGTVAKSIAAYAGGRIGAGVAASLNPQPLPPRQ
ncbi:hypothetical protein [Spirosoma pollinicola]|uniref:Uncharacterized protein n=1 Tax=Spirosoma pollinicola TaxID=2057025 RepID=A0A2K8Z016_9BACT|nr:hypothetical protein [Spirosoma pollinicola]AUD03230.1 hypothetical protein CWM47_16130 [Spirosoma pollinicola]